MPAGTLPETAVRVREIVGAPRSAWWPRSAAVLIVLLLLPALTAAEEPVTSLDQLNTRLKPGNKVRVTDVKGRQVEGRVQRPATDALTLDVEGASPSRGGGTRIDDLRGYPLHRLLQATAVLSDHPGDDEHVFVDRWR